MRFSKIIVPVLVAAGFIASSVVEAQENVIEVEVGSSQTESMKKFLLEHRRELRKSKSDTSGVLKKVRQDFVSLQKGQTRSLRVTKNLKKSILIKRKKTLSNKATLRQLESSLNLKPYFLEQKKIESKKILSKEKHLNLNERQRQADAKDARRTKFLRAQNTDLGQLKLEMKTEPLKSHQAQLTRFSEKIKSLSRKLREEKSAPRTVFLDLGNTYLESHKYLNALSLQNRLKLIAYAKYKGITLGTNESALWVYKMALVRDPNDGETNFLIGKILSDMGERNLALRRVRSAEVLFEKNNQPERAVETLSFIESLESLENAISEN